jgi:hypothetical protein
MTETALTSLGHIEIFDLDPFRPDDRSDNDLRDAISPFDFEILGPGVHEDHANFAAVIGIDRAGCIRKNYAMAKRQSTAWTDLRLESGGERDAPPRRNQASLSGGEPYGFGDRRTQVVCVRFPGDCDPDPR